MANGEREKGGAGPSRGSWWKRLYEGTVSALKRVFGWIKRGFWGVKENGLGGAREESPSGLLRKEFFRRKTAVAALVFLAGLFLFVFIAPLFMPMDVNYTDPLQQNVAPCYSMRSLPRGLKKGIRSIDGFSDFTVGVSTSGKVYVWGNTENALTKKDMKDLPKELQSGVVTAAAGKDHAIAVTEEGQIVGWGDDSCGQYGEKQVLNAITMPKELALGIDPSQVKGLSCGYQATALVKTDGTAYLWGNVNTVRNLGDLQGLTNVEKVEFSNAAAVVLLQDGTITTGRDWLFTSVVTSKGTTSQTLQDYLANKRVVEIAAANKCIALLTDEGELIVSGVFENDEEKLPVFGEERLVSLSGGTRHFVAVSESGNVFAWGHNAYGQCDLKNVKGAQKAYAGSLQTYAVDGEGKLLKSVGLKGYLMGTDGRGRDVFTRIVHGGKMTLTVGGVAGIVSSLIAVIVGSSSGYFGWVDTLLMRITEIFASMPFLPFAMLLSQIIRHYSISETMRIFIIMLILGALSWTGLARMIRGQVLSEREKEFVTAAKAMGVKESKIVFRHVLPNVVSVILVSMTLNFASCLLTESSLSYLGFGVQQPQPTWGNMLNGCNNSTVIQNYWWQWLFPSLFLSLATISINVIGDALRDALDPKSSSER